MRIARFARGDEVAYGMVEEPGRTAPRRRPAGRGRAGRSPSCTGTRSGRRPDAVRLTGTALPARRRAAARARAAQQGDRGRARTTPDHAARDGRRAAGRARDVPQAVDRGRAGRGTRSGYPVKLTRAGGLRGRARRRHRQAVPPGAARAGAPTVIFGYTCANDVTARDLQEQDGQWARAKGFDTFCPLGPWIETDARPRRPGADHDRQRRDPPAGPDARSCCTAWPRWSRTSAT